MAEGVRRTSEIEVYGSVKEWIDQHGEEGASRAAYKADAMRDKGDLDGAAVWRRIVAAINELVDIKPGDGDAVH